MRFLAARLDKESVKIRKESKKAKMTKKRKNTSILIHFAKQRRKESTEIKEHEQETHSSRPTCSTSASQSTEFDSTEKRLNLDRPDIAKILSPNRSNNADKLHLRKNLFRQSWRSSNGIQF